MKLPFSHLKNYVLRGHEPVPEDDWIAWGIWYETADRVVAKTENEHFEVSTVFLGIDHNYLGGEPLLFETLIFLKDSDDTGDMWRYHTWMEAEAGHYEVVAKLTRELADTVKLMKTVGAPKPDDNEMESADDRDHELRKDH